MNIRNYVCMAVLIVSLSSQMVIGMQGSEDGKAKNSELVFVALPHEINLSIFTHLGQACVSNQDYCIRAFKTLRLVCKAGYKLLTDTSIAQFASLPVENEEKALEYAKNMASLYEKETVAFMYRFYPKMFLGVALDQLEKVCRCRIKRAAW